MIDRIASLLKMQKPLLNRGLLFGSGPTVPENGSDGWQTGAIFQHTDGDAGEVVYVNNGSVTDSLFDNPEGGDTLTLAELADVADGFETRIVETGTYANTADSGVVLSATNEKPVSWLFDDGGAALGSADYRPTLSRVLLTVDQTAGITINAVRGQIKMLDLVDVSGSSVIAPVCGYLELAGTGARTLNSHVACVRAALEEGASGATSVTKYLAGFEATLTSTRTYSGAGLSAAFLADISGGTSKWQYGLYLEAGSVLTTGVFVGTAVTGVDIGVCTTGILMTGVTGRAIDIVTSGVVRLGIQGTGVPLSTALPFALEIHNETPADIVAGSTGLSAGVYNRYEVSVDQTSQCSHVSLVGKLRVKADLADGAHAGVLGYVEISGVGTVISGTSSTTTAAGHFAVEADASFELSTGHLNGVVVDSSVNSGATLTGSFIGVRVKRSGSSKAWESGISLEDSSCTIGMSVGVCSSGVVITGATAYAIDIATSGVFRMGVQDTGVSLTTAYPFAMDVQCEANSDIAAGATGSSAGMYVRYAIEFDQTEQCNHIAMFGKLRVKKDLADGNHVGVYGLVEESGAGTVIGGTATTVTAAGHFALDMDSSFELSTGYLCGIVVDSSVDDASTISGTMLGIRLKKSSGAYAWPVGISLDDDSCVVGIDVGACSGNGVNVSGTFTSADSRSFKSDMTVDNPAHGDGYSANEFQLNVTGTAANHIAAGGMWVNINSGTHNDSNFICAQTNGVYQAAGSITGKIVIFGMRMAHQCTNNGGTYFYPWSIVSAGGLNDTTALIHCSAAAINLGAVTDGGSDDGVLVPLYQEGPGGNIGYVRIYSHS